MLMRVPPIDPHSLFYLCCRDDTPRYWLDTGIPGVQPSYPNADAIRYLQIPQCYAFSKERAVFCPVYAIPDVRRNMEEYHRNVLRALWPGMLCKPPGSLHMLQELAFYITDTFMSLEYDCSLWQAKAGIRKRPAEDNAKRIILVREAQLESLVIRNTTTNPFLFFIFPQSPLFVSAGHQYNFYTMSQNGTGMPRTKTSLVYCGSTSHGNRSNTTSLGLSFRNGRRNIPPSY